MSRIEARGPGARAPGPEAERRPPPRPRLYALGAYGAFPLLALLGGLLLSRVDSPAGFALAGALLAAALALPVWLGTVCRRCGERPLPRLLRLLALPSAVCAGLASRSATGAGQFLAFGLVGVSAVLFALGWGLAGRRVNPRDATAGRSSAAP